MTHDLNRAIELRRAGKPEEALNILRKLAQEWPEDPNVSYQCAWAYDLTDREREAIPLYERAMANGLSGRDLEGAVLSLGSSYRAVGAYERAAEVLEDGATRFPQNRAMQVFLAMALHNTGEHRRATELLLRNLAETTGDEEILAYREALLFYADKLDETW